MSHLIRLILMGAMAALLSTVSTAAAVPTPGRDTPALHRAKGALSGATVYLSPGHGWLWNGTKWTTQRGVTHGLIEDHSNAEAALQYLVPYLQNAGARVVTMRERDMNTNMAIVEAGGRGFESDGPWESEMIAGAWRGKQWKVKASERGTRTARFTPDIPESGFYAVYTWHRTSAEDATTTAALVTVSHAGGSTEWKLDQNLNGQTWNYAGTHYFEKGSNAAAGSVTFSSRDTTTGSWLTASAVRFGGGMGDAVRGGSTSGKPRWEESGLYHAIFNGYAAIGDTRRFNSVSAMPMWAEWESEPAEKGKAIYFAWHTNAHNGTARGLSSFYYGPNAWGPTTEFTGYPGGLELGTAAHTEVMKVVRALHAPSWPDLGQICRWLGETNPRNNNKMPMALLEYGFHDNAEDADLIVSPDYRQACARASYRGIVEYFAKHVDGFDNATLLPEPPTHLVAVGNGASAEIRWQAPASTASDPFLGDAATSYRVYTSRNGYGFDEGRDAEGTEFTLAGIAEDGPLYIRVTALNAGGESFPTETLAIRPGANVDLLVVNGFDRLDRDMNETEDGGARRGILARMNTRDYIVQHAGALGGTAFDSASDEAVTSGTVALSDYRAVVWILGQERGATAFDEAQQSAIRGYLADGGSLLVSGSEYATGADGKFLSEVLGIASATNAIGKDRVAAVPDTPLSAVPEITLGGGQNIYRTNARQSLVPSDGARAVLVYTGGSEVAAVLRPGKGRVIALGFPLELVGDNAARRELARRAMEFLLPATEAVAAAR